MDFFSDKIVYSVIYHLARAFMNTFGPLDIYGQENIPAGGCVFASNHLSFLDPPLVGCCIHREMFFLARKTLQDNPLLAKIFPYCNVILIDRDGGSDVGAFKKMFRILKEGHAVLVFPEGTRSKDGKPGKPQGGAGLIACKAKVPVVPVRIFGSNQVLPRGSCIPRRASLKVCFGAPVVASEFDPGKDHPDRFREASRFLMSRILALEPPPLKY